MMTRLDPADEDHDSERGVVDELPVGETIEVRVDVGRRKQGVELVVDGRRTVDAEDGAADGHDDDDDVEDVPEPLEVRQTDLLDLKFASETV